MLAFYECIYLQNTPEGKLRRKNRDKHHRPIIEKCHITAVEFIHKVNLSL